MGRGCGKVCHQVRIQPCLGGPAEPSIHLPPPNSHPGPPLRGELAVEDDYHPLAGVKGHNGLLQQELLHILLHWQVDGTLGRKKRQLSSPLLSPVSSRVGVSVCCPQPPPPPPQHHPIYWGTITFPPSSWGSAPLGRLLNSSGEGGGGSAPLKFDGFETPPPHRTLQAPAPRGTVGVLTLMWPPSYS